MGSCLSTNTSSKSKHPKTSRIANPTPKNSNISKSPPLEEETVKEVLSETRTSPSSRAQINHRTESPFIKNAPLLVPNFTTKTNVHQNGVVYKKPYVMFAGDDVSEDLVSEICSTIGESDSVSVSMNVTEKRVEKSDEKIRRSSPSKLKNTAFSGDMKRDKTVGRSPGRRSEPSPGRARPAPVSGNGRRDTGEISGRRSKSPVTRMDSGPSKMGSGRNMSTRKTGKSPARVGSGFGERTRKVDEERRDSGDKMWPSTGAESVENPLVSLECFIFL
ncbi:hypothetical protein CASFOL_014220 [Castilleja foliolosa]|uniref:Uncharacterized protein n=1 Tax=Castilleja foliolosa TaxID=1961234 RepID=A0ABD3DRC3_9LAMI